MFIVRTGGIAALLNIAKRPSPLNQKQLTLRI